uniref:Predicted protein n=1 Tax=Hordeum vulgare subsp. vulgare TaxID=112509 RepID=F2DPQ1_HORVV|nr:predicted protein [Hordeum vulgare subsp. vulgare]
MHAAGDGIHLGYLALTMWLWWHGGSTESSQCASTHPSRDHKLVKLPVSARFVTTEVLLMIS